MQIPNEDIDIVGEVSRRSKVSLCAKSGKVELRDDILNKEQKQAGLAGRYTKKNSYSAAKTTEDEFQ